MMAEPVLAQPPAWWAGATGYQVYVRSFADGDGDGLGDLRGLAGRLAYLAWLGVDVVWLNPFYVSPMRDGGYDVADYCDVDPRLGSLADFDAVVARAHDLSLRVIIDIVPNHTSSDHPWFVHARSSRDSPYRDYYIWRDPASDGGPPNNWVSIFGGDAWTYEHATGQYWLHLFLPEMPDLNWANPAVADEFDAILTFWLDRGVDGFRVDVAHAVLKHPDLPDLPPAEDAGDGQDDQDTNSTARWRALAHVYDLDQPATPGVYRRWRKLVDARDGVLVGEVYLLDAAAVGRYVADQQGLHASFWLRLLHCRWEADALRTVLAAGVEEIGHATTWPLGTHDRPRTATRFGGAAEGRQRALALATLVFGLPGVPFVYQGEELGLSDVALPPAAMRDPVAWRDGPHHSRDPARTPMPWEPVAGYGFTAPEVSPWLPFGPRQDGETVAVQRDDPGSTLHRVRALIAVRRAVSDLAGAAETHWLDAPGDPVLAYRRGSTVVMANTLDDAITVAVPAGAWRVAFDSLAAGEGAVVSGEVALQGRQGLILVAG
jgi:alpha-glucosidase